MRFAIWHSPRVGSTVLCEMLGLTGVAGFADWVRCGFSIGFPTQAYTNRAQWRKRLATYFDNQKTSNGVTSTKLSFKYLDDIKHVAILDWFIEDIILAFDKHIVLDRRDKVAQAVSFYIAGGERHFNSKSAQSRPPANKDIRFNAYHIAHNIRRIAIHESGYNAWLNELGIDALRLTYEDWSGDLRGVVAQVIDYLGIAESYEWQPPTLKRQTDSRKQEFVTRYHSWQLGVIP